MAFYFLNKLEKSITKKELEKKFREFGNLKFIGNIQDDKRDNNFNSTIAVFNQLNDEKNLLDYCKSQKIFIQKKKEKTKNNDASHKKVEFDNRIEKSISKIYNPSFYFYKDKAYGKDIENFKFENNYEALFKIVGTQTFELTTTYPGLLIGSGYNHPKLKNNDDDFQLGFFFDHTTGLPLISGSSIKGLLRAVISQKEFIKDVYDIELSQSIFENNKNIFYDAYIVSTNNKDKGIFGSDYITSHTDGEFKNPNPIKFLKILPEVTFRFQFKCSNQELDIFKKIILDFGLGAKTNTGYGKFVA